MYGMGKLLPYADLVVYTQTPEQGFLFGGIRHF